MPAARLRVLRAPGLVGLLRHALANILAGRSATFGELVGTSRTELIERAQSGDHDAFETLIRAVGDRLLAVARKILRDPDAAEDAVQQAVISAWRTLPSLRDRDRFDAWLYRLVVNACYAEAKRTRRWQATVRHIDVEPAGADVYAAIGDRDILERAFRGLTPSHRAVLVLHFFADLPLTEVAGIVGISPATARTRLHYALRSLRAALDAVDRAGEASDRR